MKIVIYHIITSCPRGHRSFSPRRHLSGGLWNLFRKIEKVVLSIIAMTEPASLIDIAVRIDSDPFMVINDTMDVIGSTIGKPNMY